jgi:hypothetical protein
MAAIARHTPLTCGQPGPPSGPGVHLLSLGIAGRREALSASYFVVTAAAAPLPCAPTRRPGEVLDGPAARQEEGERRHAGALTRYTSSKRCGWPAAVPSGSRPADAVLQAWPGLLPATAPARQRAAHRKLLIQLVENAPAICRSSQLRSQARQRPHALTPAASDGRVQEGTQQPQARVAASGRGRRHSRQTATRAACRDKGSQRPWHGRRRNRVASPSSLRVVLGVTTAGGRPPIWTPSRRRGPLPYP